jgi:hypothetical protein
MSMDGQDRLCVLAGGFAYCGGAESVVALGVQSGPASSVLQLRSIRLSWQRGPSPAGWQRAKVSDTQSDADVSRWLHRLSAINASDPLCRLFVLERGR